MATSTMRLKFINIYVMTPPHAELNNSISFSVMSLCDDARRGVNKSISHHTVVNETKMLLSDKKTKKKKLRLEYGLFFIIYVGKGWLFIGFKSK